MNLKTGSLHIGASFIGFNTLFNILKIFNCFFDFLIVLFEDLYYFEKKTPDTLIF